MKRNNLILLPLLLVSGAAMANSETVSGKIVETITQGVTVLGSVTAAASTLIVAGLAFVLAIKVGKWGKSAIKQS